MTRINNPYFLPKRKLPGSGDNTFDPRQFKIRVEALPVGDVVGTAQEIHRQLRVMNGCEIPVADRMRNLELILVPLLFVLDGLADSYSRETLPLGKRSLLMFKLNASLYLLIVQAYKVVLDQYHQESLAGHLLHKHNRAVALHRAIYFLGRSLLHAYQLYQSAPKYIWQEIHGIHHYAVELHLDNKELESEDHRIIDHSSVSDLYKQILLLSLACPYRLLLGEVTRVYMALSQWAPKCRLIGLKKASEGIFIVDPRGDEPPRYREEGDISMIRRGWVLDTGDLSIMLANELESLHSQIGVMRPKDAPDAISPDLLARLMLTWGVGVQRSADRTESQGEVSLICELDVLYSMFGGEEAPELFSNGINVTTISAEEALKAENASRTGADEHVVEGGADLLRFKKWIEENARRDVLPPTVDINDGIGKADICIRKCMVFDESAQGYHLGWYGKGDSQIRVGELVGIRPVSNANADDVRLGVVRWLQSDKPGMLNFGIEIFRGEVEPIILRRSMEGLEMPVSWRGFLLNSDIEEDYLIVPPFYSAGDRKVVLVQGEKCREISLSKMIEATASFAQFYFKERVKNNREKTSADNKQAHEVETEASGEFDELWENI